MPDQVLGTDGLWAYCDKYGVRLDPGVGGHVLVLVGLMPRSAASLNPGWRRLACSCSGWSVAQEQARAVLLGSVGWVLGPWQARSLPTRLLIRPCALTPSTPTPTLAAQGVPGHPTAHDLAVAGHRAQPRAGHARRAGPAGQAAALRPPGASGCFDQGWLAFTGCCLV